MLLYKGYRARGYRRGRGTTTMGTVEIESSINDTAEFQMGSTGYYYRIIDDLGVKILKRGSLSTAQIEYLFYLYAQNNSITKGLTCEALACGLIRLRINNTNKSKPGIWLRHIEGITAYHYAVELGFEHNNKFDKVQAFLWGYECEEYKPIIDRMDYICEALKSIGFSCEDHNDNTRNFMVDINSNVIAIDFGIEKQHISKVILNKIYELHGTKLAITIPIEYLTELSMIGISV